MSLDVFQGIVGHIRDDATKLEIIINMIQDSKLDHEDELKIAYDISRKMNSSEKLRYLAIELINQGDVDSRELRKIIEDIRDRNQAEVRNIAIHLASVDKFDSDVFLHTCDLMTNMAELRKVVVYFIENNSFDNYVFQHLIDVIAGNNRAELRKIALVFIEHGYYEAGKFREIVNMMFDGNSKQASVVMEELLKYDKKLFEDILNDQNKSNSDVIKLKSKL